MSSDQIRLKIDCLLRRMGLTRIPTAVLICIVCLCLGLVLLVGWRYWPTGVAASEDYAVNTATSTDQGLSDSAAAQAGELAIDVEGAVAKPGLYRLALGLRVGDAIECAGGFTSAASTTSVNLAQKLEDGIQLYVPTRREVASGVSATSSAGASGALTSKPTSSGASEKIDINTATSEQLQELSGIGETLAQRIIDYRESNGRFKNIEEIQEVSGIGAVRFEAIKDRIHV